MTDEWLWVSHDGEVVGHGSREFIEAERDAYEQFCRDRGIVPAVTYFEPVFRVGAG